MLRLNGGRIINIDGAIGGFNTSHVKVKLCSSQWFRISTNGFNTSHVKVKLNIQSMYSDIDLEFQYIAC